MIIIYLVSLVELYLAYKVASEYAGVYEIRIFIPLIFQPFFYNALFREDKTYLKFKIIGIGLLSFILPLTIYFTLPNYTYNEGKQMVERYVRASKNTVFIDISSERDTIPLTNNPKRLFISNRAYYYAIKSTVDNKYFMVNPITGKVMQLSEDYWTSTP